MSDQNDKSSPDRQVFSRQQAAEYLGICVRSLDSLTADGELPHFKARSRVLYDKGTLDQWIRGQQRRGKHLTPEEAILVTSKLQLLLDAWQAANDECVSTLQMELMEFGFIVPALPRNCKGAGDA